VSRRDSKKEDFDIRIVSILEMEQALEAELNLEAKRFGQG
jgi:hypothetical protein